MVVGREGGVGIINEGTDAPLKSKRGALGGELFCCDLRDVEKAERLNADTVEGCRVTFPPLIRKQSVQCWNYCYDSIPSTSPVSIFTISRVTCERKDNKRPRARHYFHLLLPL